MKVYEVSAVQPLHNPPEPPETISVVVDAAKATLEQEFQLSQRLDSKIQYQLAVATGWFGAAQLAAVGLLADGDVDDGWLAATTTLALGTLFLLAVAAFRAFGAWKLRDDIALSPDQLRGWIDRTYARDPQAAGELGKAYARVLEERRSNNDKRVTAVEKTFFWCAVAVGLAAVELVVALAARILAG